MLEVRLIPTLVATYAHRVEFGNLLAGRVTGPAIQLFMVLIKRPAGCVVREAGALLGIVTLSTWIGFVAVIADGVNLFLRLLNLAGLFDIVAVAAVFLFMTIDAAESKEVDVFFMLERYDWCTRIRSLVNLLDRFGDHRVRFADNVGRIFARVAHSAVDIGYMTQNTFRVVAPFTVARQTLAMICAFEVRFLEIGRFRTWAMAIRARRNNTFGAVVVTSRAVGTHLRHGGVHFVVEVYGLIQIFQLR